MRVLERNRPFRVEIDGKAATPAKAHVRYKTDGSELGRSGGTYLLNKVDGVWKIGVAMGCPVKDAFKRE
jgi:hypothetical protein